MKIRHIKSSEIDLVVRLFDDYRVFYGQPSNIARGKSFLEERLKNNESVIFVALKKKGKEDIPVGFTQLYPTYSSVRTVKNWVLNDLYVTETQRKDGVGTHLIQKALSFAIENDATYVQLSTATDNTIAQSLYHTLGFKKQKRETEFITYRKALTKTTPVASNQETKT